MSHLKTSPTGCVLVACLFAMAMAPGVALAERRTLVIEGRTLDQDGYPVKGVRIEARGARRAAASSDHAGEFSLFVPLGAADDLKRSPLALKITAERKGWRFALPGGDGELGLEVRLAGGEDGSARCEARSNDARVAAAAARVIGLEGDAVAVAAVNFQGVRGAAATYPEPALTQVAKVALSGGMPSVQVSVAAAETTQKTPAATPPAKPASPTTAPRAAPAARSESPPPTSPVPSPKSDGIGPTSDTELGVAPIVPPPKHYRPMVKSSSRDVPGSARERASEEREKRERALRRLRADARERTAASGTEAESTRTGAKVGSGVRGHRVRTGIGKAFADTGTSRGPQSTPVAARRTESRSSSGKSMSRIHPPPQGTGRGRSHPLVIRNPPWPFPPEAGLDSCMCRVEGTVEVVSDKPLPARVPVTISLHWYPELSDEVELFMGSPRRFVLTNVPCGPQRLRLSVRSTQEFDIVSRDAMAGFRCEAGRSYQFRVVLAPR